MSEFIYFYNKVNNERLGGFSLQGYTVGEIVNTIDLLAYENDISKDDITFKFNLNK